MDKTTKIIAWVIVAVVIIGGVWYEISRKAEEHTNVLKVGVIIPLTGPVGPTGKDFLNGLMLAKEKINPSVELYIEDSQSNAKDGVTAAKKILDTQDVDMIISLQSAVVIPLLTLADEYNKPLLATAISQNEFTQKSKNAFRFFPSANQEAALAADFANKRGFKKISTITILDEYGVSMKEQFDKKFEGDIVQEENFTAADTDLRTILTKISNSDAIYFIGYIPQYISLFKQLKELGKDNVVISNLITISGSVRAEIGNLTNKIYATVPESALMSEKTKQFRKDYIEKYGEEPDWAAPFGYDTMFILDAVQKNEKKPIEALYNIKINGLNGNISFNGDREAFIPLSIVEIKNGQFVPYQG